MINVLIVEREKDVLPFIFWERGSIRVPIKFKDEIERISAAGQVRIEKREKLFYICKPVR